MIKYLTELLDKLTLQFVFEVIIISNFKQEFFLFNHEIILFTEVIMK